MWNPHPYLITLIKLSFWSFHFSLSIQMVDTIMFPFLYMSMSIYIIHTHNIICIPFSYFSLLQIFVIAFFWIAYLINSDRVWRFSWTIHKFSVNFHINSYQIKSTSLLLLRKKMMRVKSSESSGEKITFFQDFVTHFGFLLY